MSVNRQDYIVYGWKFDSIKDSNNKDIDIWDDKYLPFREGWEGEEFTLVASQMTSDYMVFGLLISNKNEDSCGWEFVELKFDNLNAEKVKNKFKELFGHIPFKEPSLFIFSDFS